MRRCGIDGAEPQFQCAVRKCEVRNRVPDGAEVRGA